jgi:hypothetical protein
MGRIVDAKKAALAKSRAMAARDTAAASERRDLRVPNIPTVYLW